MLRIIAAPISKNEKYMLFNSLHDAATWLITNNKAITAGRLAAYQTVKTKIKQGINQPELYPFIYGFSWKQI